MKVEFRASKLRKSHPPDPIIAHAVALAGYANRATSIQMEYFIGSRRTLMERIMERKDISGSATTS